MEKPEIEVLAPNFVHVTVGNVGVWFSYNTMIAFRVGNNLLIHENIWSRTTAKHLNQIRGRNGHDKIRRDVNETEFQAEWDRLTA